MFVNTSANVIVDRPAAEVFDFATDMENFHKVFTGWGPIPGNKSVEQLDRGKPKPGSRRRILNTDGSVVLEEIHQFSRPTAHRYRIIGGLPLPLRARHSTHGRARPICDRRRLLSLATMPFTLLRSKPRTGSE